MMREAIKGLDRIANPYLPPDDPAEPPLVFREELRRPITAERRAINVVVDGCEMAVILNPQGKVDPARETWLWNYIRGAVRDGAE
ncbi:hypothetical protein [Nonomuraea sp. GTA35]|uniref:hypothetical protein n=1 Tax=Nonomuraea sp. GTA35 TaxID=1676746 RepID=UPI0035C069AA